MDSQTTDVLVKTVIRRSLLFTLGVACVLLLVANGPLAKGAALGGLLSALNFYLMAALLPRAINPNRRRAEAFSMFSLLARFALMGGALAACLKFPGFLAVESCAPALFTVQICLIADRLLGGRLIAKPSGSS